MLLYIHIPFCDSKCFYCAFNSYTDKFSLKNDYMKALKIQLKNNIEKYVKNRNKKIETVFIGGGTPSTIKAFEYKEIFEIINPYLEEKVEITTEANPNSASFEWLETMKSLGVSRVSFGVQSFQNEKLKFLGRSHNSNSAINAIQNANKIGFKGINCDFIYGVLGDTIESIKKDLNYTSDKLRNLVMNIHEISLSMNNMITRLMAKWEPVIPFGYSEDEVADIIEKFGETVEKIEKWVKDGIEWSARGEEILEMEG